MCFASISERPTEVELKLPNIMIENDHTNVTCRVPVVKPGIGFIQFALRIDDHIIATSPFASVIGLFEEIDSSVGDGSKNVTYTTSIIWQRSHNAKNLTCSVTWKISTEIFMIEKSLKVNVVCKYCFICLYIKIVLNIQANA
jgi:hypothetical protein